MGEREGPFACPRNWLPAAVHNEGQESQALDTGAWLGREIPASSLGSQLCASTKEGQSSCSQVALGCAVKYEPGQRMREGAICCLQGKLSPQGSPIEHSHAMAHQVRLLRVGNKWQESSSSHPSGKPQYLWLSEYLEPSSMAS